MAYETERRVAIEAVIQACQLCQEVQLALVTEDTLAKKDKSPVTVADFGAQAVVSTELMRMFPCDPLVGEENSSGLRTDAGAGLKDKVIQYVDFNNSLNRHILLNFMNFGAHTKHVTALHTVMSTENNYFYIL